eukprot:gene21286-biopygen7263
MNSCHEEGGYRSQLDSGREHPPR